MLDKYLLCLLIYNIIGDAGRVVSLRERETFFVIVYCFAVSALYFAALPIATTRGCPQPRIQLPPAQAESFARPEETGLLTRVSRFTTCRLLPRRLPNRREMEWRRPGSAASWETF